MSIRIQFDLTDEEWEKYAKYGMSFKGRHDAVKNTLEEWYTRKLGRDKKAQGERILKDVKYLQELIDSGKLKL